MMMFLQVFQKLKYQIILNIDLNKYLKKKIMKKKMIIIKIKKKIIMMILNLY